MKKSLLFLILLVFVGCSPKKTHQIYHSEEGKFEVTFPYTGDIEESYDEMKGITKIYLKPLDEDDDNLLYSVQYFDDKHGRYHSDSLDYIESYLWDTQKNYFHLDGYKFINRVPCSVKGYPCSEYWFQTIDGLKFTRRKVSFVKNRVYQLEVLTDEMHNYNQYVDDFFESFQLLGVPENNPKYLNIPSKEELANRPFEVDFGDQTEVQTQALILKDGTKVVQITEMKRFETSEVMLENKQMLAMGVSYIRMPNGADMSQLEGYFIKSPNQETILTDTINAYGYLAHREITNLKMMGRNYRQVLVFFHTENNICYIIRGTALPNTTEFPKEFNDFVASFKIK